MLKQVILCCLFFSVIGLNSSCKVSSPTNQNPQQSGLLTSFQIEREKAEEYKRNDDLPNAERYFLSALKIAEAMKWTDGIVMTKMDISRLYIDKTIRDFDKVETNFLEAKTFCQQNKDCSPGQLASVYVDLFNFYLFSMKNLNKSSAIADEVINSKERLGEDESIYKVREILKEFAIKLRIEGFRNEASNLETRIKSL